MIGKNILGRRVEMPSGVCWVSAGGRTIDGDAEGGVGGVQVLPQKGAAVYMQALLLWLQLLSHHQHITVVQVVDDLLQNSRPVG